MNFFADLFALECNRLNLSLLLILYFTYKFKTTPMTFYLFNNTKHLYSHDYNATCGLPVELLSLGRHF